MAINLGISLQGPARQGWVYEIQYMGRGWVSENRYFLKREKEGY